jgi:hypothetical protein
MKGLLFLWYSNECLRHLPWRPLEHLTHLFKHCFRLGRFPAPWKGAKIITAETRQRPKISITFTCYRPPVHYVQTICETGFKNNPKTHWGNKLTKCKSGWLSSRSQYDTSMYETGGTRHPKFQHIDGCCVLVYRECLRHNMALWPNT